MYESVDQFIQDGHLVPEAAEIFLPEAIFAARKYGTAGIGRKIIAVSAEYGWGKQVATYETGTDRSAATIAHGLVDHFDQTIRSETTVPMQVIQANFRIPSTTIMAAESEGIDLVQREINAAMYQLLLKEDTLITQGSTFDGTAYDVNGWYNSLSTTESTSKDFATGGNVLDKIQLSVDAAEPYNSGPLNCGLNATQYGQARSSLTGGDGWEWEYCLNLLGGGLVYQSDDITAGTGMLTATANPDIAELIVATNYTIHMAYDPVKGEYGDLYGYVFCKEVPVIKRTYDGVKMTNI